MAYVHQRHDKLIIVNVDVDERRNNNQGHTVELKQTILRRDMNKQ